MLASTLIVAEARRPKMDANPLTPAKEANIMVQIVQVTDETYNDQIRELLVEYFRWGNARLDEEFGISLDIESIIDGDLEELEIYFPPDGGLFLAANDDGYMGIAFITEIREGVGEIRRMYVRPDYRRKGIGRILLKSAIEEGRRLGYSSVLLDSPRSWTEAHSLYKSAGFRDTDEYPESEVPADLRENWIFMALHF
jgi:GNAT superfamily N-acetyltransferase